MAVLNLCLQLLDVAFPKRCPECRAEGAWICGSCLAPLRGVAPTVRDGMTTLYPFECAVVREGLRALKYGGLPEAGRLLVDAAAVVPASGVLVPVPQSRPRRRERGYNQAEVLAVAFAGRTGLEVRADLLEKAPGGTSVGKSRAERLEVARTAVRLRPGGEVPHTVTLVDDVLTTGATLRACREALLAGGAREVRMLAVAGVAPGRSAASV